MASTRASPESTVSGRSGMGTQAPWQDERVRRIREFPYRGKSQDFGSKAGKAGARIISFESSQSLRSQTSVTRWSQASCRAPSYETSEDDQP